jgi:predicted cupin superfamily sugar epimerase
LVQIKPNGEVIQVTMGQNIGRGEKVQHLVPAGDWFGAYPNAGSGYSFVGCTVAPGFEFADFELGQRRELLQKFPKAKEIIDRLTL